MDSRYGFNPSGYRDPTATKALERVERRTIYRSGSRWVRIQFPDMPSGRDRSRRGGKEGGHAATNSAN